MSVADVEPVDLAHLDRYTGGSRPLNEEVLRLFDSQCAEMLANLDAAAASGDGKAWHLVTHTLKGAARGIGARALADAAAEAEKAEPTDGAALVRAAERVKAQLADVRAFIARFLG
jgi:HPt (histidine-containing phosphotransfer) domain-containing protein